MRHNGILVKWNEDKGFGFVQMASSQQQTFAHIKEFENRRRKPKVGDEVTFKLQQQPDGKLRATGVAYVRESVDWWMLPILIIAFGYIGGVGYASLVTDLPVEVSWAFALLSAVTYLLYALDKRAAQQSNQRTPEKVLHWLSVLGGWPGALIAQQQFRHKTRKTSFRVGFYFTVILNIAAVLYFIVYVEQFWRWI
ncbi:Uncharacterized membrane protein YsdA, DUF1294 family [Pseudidiomarina maritima]|uniref:Uncharacterized membrane protein YsdA, DUF1294 family n=1 Tax=Pseudidiomarina maritima TaxID=519453 RepID=A0A1I6GIV9_9GAMM|nr:cold shock and DUF1294 domain-containing protein [Pseudidiomarina maritima]SFR42100.1 Uncharacterized membrane protein YsdA, DUF1294 family [Pseudidiomarina maritima]